jgi:hypothetical protein
MAQINAPSPRLAQGLDLASGCQAHQQLAPAREQFLRHKDRKGSADGAPDNSDRLACKFEAIEGGVIAGPPFERLCQPEPGLAEPPHDVPIGIRDADRGTRPIPSSTVAVARLSEPYFRIEIDAMALIPKRS